MTQTVALNNDKTHEQKYTVARAWQIGASDFQEVCDLHVVRNGNVIKIPKIQ